MWTEIDISTELDSTGLKVAFAATFGIEPNRVHVTRDMTSRIDPRALIVVEHRVQPGDFPQRILVVLKDPALKRRVGDNETSIESYAMLSLLATNMKTSLLVPDRLGDPYAALLIEPRGDAFHVDLDSGFLDKTDGVKLVPDANRIPDSQLSRLVQRVS